MKDSQFKGDMRDPLRRSFDLEPDNVNAYTAITYYRKIAGILIPPKVVEIY